MGLGKNRVVGGPNKSLIVNSTTRGPKQGFDGNKGLLETLKTSFVHRRSNQRPKTWILYETGPSETQNTSFSHQRGHWRPKIWIFQRLGVNRCSRNANYDTQGLHGFKEHIS